MSAIQQVTVNGVTIKDGTEFKLQAESEQLAEDVIARAENIHSEDAAEIANELNGATLTVTGITRDPGGTHFEITTPLNEETPVSIMQFAIEQLLQDGSLEAQ